MTYGIARAETSDELILNRTPGKKSIYYAAIEQPRTIYTARINQTFSTRDGVVSLIFDSGSGTLGSVLPDMLMYIGSSAGARDVSFVRLRGHDSTHFYIDQVSAINFQDNQYLTVVDHFRLLQRHIDINGDTIRIDQVDYTDQHSKPDPTPIMGNHRIFKMSGSSIATQFHFGDSYVIDGTSVTAYLTQSPTALSVTGSTTATPTVTFDTCGWHCVYLTVTGENGNSFFAVRKVFVWNDGNLPALVKITDITGDVQSGGWQAEIEMYRNAGVTDIYEGMLCFIFSIDYWGDTEESIGAVLGSENIEAVGWVGSPESISWNPERGSVNFSVLGPHLWMEKIAAYPAGVDLVVGIPTKWTEFQNLTVDKGIWHFLHWRTTATRILDFFPSGNAFYTAEVASLADNLWAQIQEMAWLQIYARPGFNAQGQLFLKVHPQLTPEVDRTWATVLEITKDDWIAPIDFDRKTIPELAELNISGMSVDGAGNGTAYFSNAPGHTLDHYGKHESQDKLLVSSQAETNILAGLYYAWANNELPEIPITLTANNRLIDLFPNSFCSITLNAEDTVRGIAYSGNLIPKRIQVHFDDKTGRTTREVIFEAESFQGLSVTENVPGSGDVSTGDDLLVDFTFPTDDVLITGTPIDAPTGGPRKVLVHDTGGGLAYSVAFNGVPFWLSWNAGLTSDQYKAINKVRMTPGGQIYIGCRGPTANHAFLAYADYLGGTFTILEDEASIESKTGSVVGGGSLSDFDCNPFVADTVLYVLTKNNNAGSKSYIGGSGTFVHGVDFTCESASLAVSYGGGQWLVYGNTHRFILNAAATAVVTSNTVFGFTVGGIQRISTSLFTYHWGDGNLYKGSANLNSYVTITSPGIRNGGIVAIDPTGSMLMSYHSVSTPLKSSDSGYSFSSIGTLPVVQSYGFAYVGGVGGNSQWIAVSNGGYIYYTDSFFINAPIDKRGNITSIFPFPHLDIVKVIEV